MYHGLWRAFSEQGGEFGSQHIRVLERTASIQIVLEKAIERAGDVPCHGVEWLHLATVSGCATGIDQGLLAAGQLGMHAGGVAQFDQRWAQGKV